MASIYVRLSNEPITHTVAEYKFSGTKGVLNVDYDANNEVVGFEVLEAIEVEVEGRQVWPY